MLMNFSLDMFQNISREKTLTSNTRETFGLSFNPKVSGAWEWSPPNTKNCEQFSNKKKCCSDFDGFFYVHLRIFYGKEKSNS